MEARERDGGEAEGRAAGERKRLCGVVGSKAKNGKSGRGSGGAIFFWGGRKVKISLFSVFFLITDTVASLPRPIFQIVGYLQCPSESERERERARNKVWFFRGDREKSIAPIVCTVLPVQKSFLDLVLFPVSAVRFSC